MHEMCKSIKAKGAENAFVCLKDALDNLWSTCRKLTVSLEQFMINRSSISANPLEMNNVFFPQFLHSFRFIRVPSNLKEIDKISSKNSHTADSPFFGLCIILFADSMSSHRITEICIRITILDDWQPIFQIERHSVVDTECEQHQTGVKP